MHVVKDTRRHRGSYILSPTRQISARFARRMATVGENPSGDAARDVPGEKENKTELKMFVRVRISFLVRVSFLQI